MELTCGDTNNLSTEAHFETTYVVRWKAPFNDDMAPSDARVLNGGSLIEFSTLYIERRVPPYDSSLGVFRLPPFSFS